MLAALRAALAKDLRLLIRDRAGLVFLSLAPVVVISVAGFSLAGLFGAPIGGYVLPLADEDHGRLGRVLRSGLEEDAAIEVRPVADRDAARALVRRGAAGAALVIPAGASAALRAGQPVSLLLYTDPVKYLEVANVRALVQEARQRIEASGQTRVRHRLAAARHDARAARRRFERSARALRRAVDGLAARLAAARTDTERRLTALRGEASAAVARRAAVARGRLAAELAPLRQFLDELATRQRAFADWLTEARARAGRFADRLPPPPAPPPVPSAVAALAGTDATVLAERIMPPEELELPHVALPAVPTLPALDFPARSTSQRRASPGHRGGSTPSTRTCRASASLSSCSACSSACRSVSSTNATGARSSASAPCRRRLPRRSSPSSSPASWSVSCR